MLSLRAAWRMRPAMSRAVSSKAGGGGYQVLQVPIFSDNYSHVVVDESSGVTAAVDPADPAKHADHSGGNEYLASQYGSELKIYGSAYEDCPAVTHPVRANDKFDLGSLAVEVLYTPCHTSGHVQFLVRSSTPGQPAALFCGDTLFVGGCGRFFEGDAHDMHRAMEQLASLPPDTVVYCGHEYTLSNLKFAMTIEPDNMHLKKKMEWAVQQRGHSQSTVPTTIGDEMRYNPFMRTHEAGVQRAVGSNDPVEVMRILRERKDKF